MADSLYQLGQWYPRVMVYDDIDGWDTEPYLGISEFYNNYGRFDVTLDVPTGWLVGATGVLQNPETVLTPKARSRLTQALLTDSVLHVVGPGDRGAGRVTGTGANGRLQWHFVADTQAVTYGMSCRSGSPWELRCLGIFCICRTRPHHI